MVSSSFTSRLLRGQVRLSNLPLVYIAEFRFQPTSRPHSILSTLVLRTLTSSVEPTILHTQMRPRVLIRPITSLRTEVRIPLRVMFLSNSALGGWSADGITLPGAIDLEGQ